MASYQYMIPTVIDFKNNGQNSFQGKIIDQDAKIRDATSLPKFSFVSKDIWNFPRVRSYESLSATSSFVVLQDSDDSPTDSEEGSPKCLRVSLGHVLLAEWQDREAKGLFKYDVTACPTKTIDGDFISQLNVGRATKKRATEFKMDQVAQPFDDNKFNFTKAAQKEVLFQLEAGGSTHFAPTADVGEDSNLVIINISPIEHGHILLVPRVNRKLPQVVDPESMDLALQMAYQVQDPFFRVGYNSLGAIANEGMHTQLRKSQTKAYFLGCTYPVEKAPCKHIADVGSEKGVGMLVTQDYPVAGIVYEVGSSLSELAQVVGCACQKLAAANIPHNFLICDSGARVFLWPQCYAQKQAEGVVPEELLETGVNPAAFEIAGHMVLKREEDYESLNRDLATRLLAEVSLSPQKFNEVLDLLKE